MGERVRGFERRLCHCIALPVIVYCGRSCSLDKNGSGLSAIVVHGRNGLLFGIVGENSGILWLICRYCREQKKPLIVSGSRVYSISIMTISRHT